MLAGGSSASPEPPLEHTEAGRDKRNLFRKHGKLFAVSRLRQKLLAGIFPPIADKESRVAVDLDRKLLQAAGAL
ncbi:hypothetical protein BMW22_32865 (plasmid) [Rhizobium leguminosarum]|uniref:Uncharacterized protein n=1 Tax=Rhizobium leguminosarum TaxID=384 RepID=A0A1L3ZKY3_RHILE|nr:hypothetical protein [Rhizobium leguminosarum]API56305.1 hypothetical protein BMW22_32865 [Rhizobium leguminosarum]